MVAKEASMEAEVDLTLSTMVAREASTVMVGSMVTEDKVALEVVLVVLIGRSGVPEDKEVLSVEEVEDKEVLIVEEAEDKEVLMVDKREDKEDLMAEEVEENNN